MKRVSQTLALGVCLAFAVGCATEVAHNNTNKTATNTAVNASNAVSAAATPQQVEADGVTRIGVQESKAAFDKGTAVIVDTRADVAYKAEHIKGSINIPTETMATRFNELPKDKQIIFYCS